MKLAKKGQSGQALIMALILLALGGLVITPLLMQTATNLKYHNMIQQETLRAYSADAGVEYGLCEVFNNPEEYQSAPLDYSYDINNTTVNVTAQYVPSMAAYKIVSTATSPDNRSTTIETYVIIEIGLFGNAFACDGNLEVIGCNLTSDSPGGCDVYANGNVKLLNSDVDGDVFASGTITLDNSDVSGEITPGAEVLDFPAIDPQPHEDAAKEENDIRNQDVTYDSGTHEIGPFYIDGGHSLNINNCEVTLEGTLYVTGDVDINNATISGFGDIVAEGDISINNHTFNVDNPDTLPLIMTIGVGAKIDINNDIGDPGTEAVVYAPDGEIALTNVDVYGSVAADMIVVTNAEIHYPASLKGRPDLPGAGLETISYGYK